MEPGSLDCQGIPQSANFKEAPNEFNGDREHFEQMELNQIDTLMGAGRKEDPQSLPHILHINEFEMDHGLKCKRLLSEENIGNYLHELGVDKNILDKTQKNT